MWPHTRLTRIALGIGCGDPFHPCIRPTAGRRWRVARIRGPGGPHSARFCRSEGECPAVSRNLILASTEVPNPALVIRGHIAHVFPGAH